MSSYDLVFSVDENDEPDIYLEEVEEDQ